MNYQHVTPKSGRIIESLVISRRSSNSPVIPRSVDTTKSMRYMTTVDVGDVADAEHYYTNRDKRATQICHREHT